KTYNGTSDSNDVANSLCLDNTGNVYVTGWSRGINSNADITTIKYSQLIGIIPISSEIPNEYSLSQNYPNPFNPVTKIRFSIPPYKGGKGDVILKVYDIQGRQVAVLLNENKQPGTYEIDFDAGGLSSGIYFYKLIADGFIDTRKMILVK
ncbi:MAG TPA: T9SS type A sorting domain-containing protein, partial [Ignavibacteria bacterium]|nr:T9SS type A sorting domain-containing protein [Ignavibacteria bacterium]